MGKSYHHSRLLQDQAEKGIANLTILIARGIHEALLVGMVIGDKVAARLHRNGHNAKWGGSE